MHERGKEVDSSKACIKGDEEFPLNFQLVLHIYCCSLNTIEI
jgi:hypothetical protein